MPPLRAQSAHFEFCNFFCYGSYRSVIRWQSEQYSIKPSSRRSWMISDGSGCGHWAKRICCRNCAFLRAVVGWWMSWVLTDFVSLCSLNPAKQRTSRRMALCIPCLQPSKGRLLVRVRKAAVCLWQCATSGVRFASEVLRVCGVCSWVSQKRCGNGLEVLFARPGGDKVILLTVVAVERRQVLLNLCSVRISRI